MNKFKLGIITCFLLGAIACSKDDNTSPKEDIIEDTPQSQLQCDNDLGIVVKGTLKHNSEMTFTSETDLFGDNGPDLIYRSDLSTATEDTRYDISQAEGLGNIAQVGETPLIERAEGMPFNKAFVIGSEGSVTESPSIKSFRVKSPLGSTPATYEHVMYWWPKEHQENAQPHLNSKSTWQIKTIWHFYTGSKADDRIRFHNVFGSFFKNGLYFMGSAMTGNLGTKYAWYPGLKDDDFTTNPSTSYLKDDKFISQTFIKHSPLNDGSGVIDFYMRNVNKGTVGHKTKSDDRTAITRDLALDNHLGPDQFTLPGYARGFNTQIDAHAYFSDVYIAHGVGAAARIELVNNSDYEKANKVSPFTIESWSSKVITVKSKMGIFSTQMDADEDLYFAIHNQDNKLVAMIKYCGPKPE